MARKKRSQTPPMSFLSFLDIMASLIGILSLIIILLILSQVDPGAVQAAERELKESVERAEAAVQIKREMEPLEKEKQRLEQLAAQLEKTRQEAERSRAKLTELEEKRRGMTEAAKMAASAAELKQQAEGLTQQQVEMTQKVESMEKELAARKAPRDDAEIKVRLSGSGEGLDPFFVEVNTAGLVIYGTAAEPIVVPAAQIAAGEAFKALMETVKARPNGTIIFLIRDDALHMYNHASNVATNNYVRNGKLPILGKGKVTLPEAGAAAEPTEKK